MVDDVVVAEPRAVLVGPGVAQRAEQVAVVARALGGDPRVQEPLEHLASGQAPRPAPARDREADHRGSGADAVGERAVEPVGLRAELEAHEGARRDVEGELLERRVDLEVALRRPGREAVGQRRVHRLEVAGQAIGGERLLHDPPVPVVLVEVEQHQPAVEERPDQRRPARAVGERVVAVLQHDAGRFGALHGHELQPERAHPGHRSVLVVALAGVVQLSGQDVEGVADERQPAVAGDLTQLLDGHGFDPILITTRCQYRGGLQWPGRTAGWRSSTASPRGARPCIETALDCLHDDGLSGVGVRSICARARLTPRYFYESFADLDELLVAVVDAVAAEVAAARSPRWRTRPTTWPARCARRSTPGTAWSRPTGARRPRCWWPRPGTARSPSAGPQIVVEYAELALAAPARAAHDRRSPGRDGDGAVPDRRGGRADRGGAVGAAAALACRGRRQAHRALGGRPLRLTALCPAMARRRARFTRWSGAKLSKE